MKTNISIMKRSFFPVVLGLVALLISTGCGKDLLKGDEDIVAIQDYMLSESEFSAISKVFEAEASNDDVVKKTGSTNGFYCNCSTIEGIDNGDGTYTLTVDYGNGCLCIDGRTRYGKLVGTLSGKWSQQNVVLEVVPVNYQIQALNGVTYDFDFNYRLSRGASNNGNPVYDVVVTNGVIFSPEQGTIEWQDTRRTEWTSGFGDLNPLNNEFSITGNATGVASNGDKFTATTSTPLIVKGDCPHVVQGVLALKPENRLERVIDYGDGTCDNKAKASIGFFSTEITLF